MGFRITSVFLSLKRVRALRGLDFFGVQYLAGVLLSLLAVVAWLWRGNIPFVFLAVGEHGAVVWIYPQNLE